MADDHLPRPAAAIGGIDYGKFILLYLNDGSGMVLFCDPMPVPEYVGVLKQYLIGLGVTNLRTTIQSVDLSIFSRAFQEKALLFANACLSSGPT